MLCIAVANRNSSSSCLLRFCSVVLDGTGRFYGVASFGCMTEARWRGGAIKLDAGKQREWQRVCLL